MEMQSSSLVPPSISSIIGTNNTLKPSKEQEDVTLEKSREYWYHAASLTYTYLENGLAPEFTSPQHALHRVPKFQGPLKTDSGRPLGNTAIFALCSPASSTWRLGDSGCDAIKKEITKHVLVQIGTATTIPFSFCGDVFSHWIGTATEKSTAPNYIGILAIGWCYILSARLIELQEDGAIMRYTSSHAECLDESPHGQSENNHIIDVAEGVTDARVVRWWSAILAKGKGWEATVKDGPRSKYVAPWGVSRTCELSFIINQNRCSDSLCSTQNLKPLSSDDAFDALLEFASLHGLGSQFPIALTVAMSFPMHRFYGSDVKLPPPRAHGGNASATSDGTSPLWRRMKEDLPYYMTLSCSPETMISTLCGSFWEADVPCNLVSQWLHPLEEILGSATESKGQEIIALLGGIRSPSVSALWIGAAVSGIVPTLLQNIRRGKPPLDPVAFPWTGARQSFMDDAGSGPYTCGDPEYISRPDVWRLLHLPYVEEDDLSYGYGPSTPWEPCGASLVADCALRVTAHLKCPRHEYQYDHWTWEMKNGETIQDCGLLRSPPLMTEDLSNFPNIKGVSHLFERRELDPDRQASEEASHEIFRWFIHGGEGEPPEKIYQDPLLRAILEDDDDGEELDGADDPESKEVRRKSDDRLEVWLDIID